MNVIILIVIIPTAVASLSYMVIRFNAIAWREFISFSVKAETLIGREREENDEKVEERNKEKCFGAT